MFTTEVLKRSTVGYCGREEEGGKKSSDNRDVVCIGFQSRNKNLSQGKKNTRFQDINTNWLLLSITVRVLLVCVRLSNVFFFPNFLRIANRNYALLRAPEKTKRGRMENEGSIETMRVRSRIVPASSQTSRPFMCRYLLSISRSLLTRQLLFHLLGQRGVHRLELVLRLAMLLLQFPPLVFALLVQLLL